MEQAFFLLFAVVAICSATMVVVAKNPIHSALALMICFVQVAALFLLLRSPILAVIQMFVYVGAVIILFLFVIMMLDVRKEAQTRFLKKGTVGTVVVVALLCGEMVVLLLGSNLLLDRAGISPDVEMNSVREISVVLFTEYLFPFEIASVILLVALVGAIILTRHSKEEG
ncbi:NADH-quinone oxidoreductase subunit J [Kiloniella sp.]|uniref:NADH-quinone oxidoreductase subunit J family protein n=1 Tax=Kiloniella sp. TaxID=1938587 RepID=UPI003B018E96